MPQDHIFLDFETFSLLDLPEVGTDRYAKDPSTGISMLGWALNSEDIEVWFPRLSPPPKKLIDALRNPDVIKIAWNVSFEFNILKYVMGPKHVEGGLDIPIEQWRDPMILAHHLSLPGKLESVANILKMEQKKDERGKQLMKLFCQPASRGGEQTLFGIAPPLFRTPESHPREWAEYADYCRQDVRAERDLWFRMSKIPLPETEWRGWFLNQKINSFGMPGRRARAEKGLRLINRFMDEQRNRLKALTGLSNTNSPSQMKEWAGARGYPWNSMRANYVQTELDNPQSLITKECREALKIRATCTKSSYKKLERFLSILSDDERLRNQFRYMGAARTGRWASGDVQVQNLPRGLSAIKDRLTRALELVDNEDYSGIVREFTNTPDPKKSATVAEFVITLMRSLFEAPPGKKIVVADLNAIENRVLGWAAGCWPILEVFTKPKEDGGDPYLSFGARLFNKTYAEMWASYISGNKDDRQNSKPAVLGCLGGDTLVLTQWGLKSILDILPIDCIFDGESWVNHEGLLDKGIQSVVYWNGVGITKDHGILTPEGWRPAWDLNQDSRLGEQATNLAIGLLSSTELGNNTMENGEASIYADALAGSKNLSTHPIWRQKKLVRALNVRIGEFWKKKVLSLPPSLPLTEQSLTASVTDITQYYPDAEGQEAQQIAMLGEELNANFPHSTILLRTLSLCPNLTESDFNSIEKITTEIIRSGMYDSLHQRSTTEIKKIYAGLHTKVSGILRSSLQRNLHPGTETRGRSRAKFVLDYLPNKLYPVKQNAEAHTYDILNSGPLHRFLIITANGPAVVHNCGYGLGGGELTKNEFGDMVQCGLWGYAKNVCGVDMPRDLAHKAVKIFRDAYPEVVRFWADLEEAFKQVLTRGGIVRVGEVTWDKDQREWVKHPNSLGCVLTFTRIPMDGGGYIVRMEPPSGRGLHYVNATIDAEEKVSARTGRTYTSYQIRYDGIEHSATQGADGATAKKRQTWGRTKTYGGKICENVVQAIARDILLHGMFLADQMGFDIWGLFHDELATEADNTPFGLCVPDLVWCMSQVPDWAPGLLLGADGFEGSVYRKD